LHALRRVARNSRGVPRGVGRGSGPGDRHRHPHGHDAAAPLLARAGGAGHVRGHGAVALAAVDGPVGDAAAGDADGLGALAMTGDIDWGFIGQYLAEFAQVSLLAFGGATSALPEMHRRVVVEHGWVSEAQFAEMFG